MNQSYGYDYDLAQSGYGDVFAAEAARDERVSFIRRTYLHLFGAILAFIALETVFFSVEPLRNALIGAIGGNWWIALIAFLIVSWLAQRWAFSGASTGTQYAGLALYTVAEALIFVPLLFMAQVVGGPGLIPTAAFLTMLIFGGLTAVVFITKQDFSFLRNILWLGGLAMIGVIVASFFFEFSSTFHLVFVVGVIILLSGYILYDTSNVLHHYRTDQHVAASLALFASVATLFWYVIRLLMILSSDD